MGLARYIAEVSSRLRKGSSTSPPEPAVGPEAGHLRLGRLGERAAARYLRRHGMKVLYRNFRPDNGGEIDLVCREKKTLVFIEVKTRAPEGLGRPADAVDVAKEEALMRGAQAWLRMLGNPDVPVRLDIVEVILGDGRPEITHTRDALAFAAKR
jgi:putative endonuclease